ncbi:MAG: type II toxin-antitoxin system VapC family toxin [Geminicoccaceae bacterium]
MYILDTNVLSEVMKDAPHPAVVAWLRQRPMEIMFATAISYTEILYGVRRLADGARRQKLAQAARALFLEEFEARILHFDADAADAYADLRVARIRMGRPVAMEDGMIGAIATVRGASVVTRDVGGFDGYGLTVLNPWEDR